MSTCRSCGAPVRFAKAASGRWMILDAEPCEEGNVIVIAGQAVALTRAELETRKLLGDATARYLDHHVTCPQAKDWRGRGASS